MQAGGLRRRLSCGGDGDKAGDLVANGNEVLNRVDKWLSENRLQNVPEKTKAVLTANNCMDLCVGKKETWKDVTEMIENILKRKENE